MGCLIYQSYLCPPLLCREGGLTDRLRLHMPVHLQLKKFVLYHFTGIVFQ